MNETVGKRLQNLRESKRPIKARSVTSELMGLDTGALRRYERDECIPSTRALIAIAEYYKVSIDYILMRTDKIK